MPYPSYDYITELDPVTLAAGEDFATQLVEYLSKEHKNDGSHGAITADSLTTPLATITSLTVTTETLTTLNATIVNAAAVNASTVIATILQAISAGVTVFDARQVSPGVYTVSVGSLGNPATLSVTGDVAISDDLDVTDDFAINTNKFTVDGGTGNTVIAGTLDVTGLLTLTGSASVGNDLNVVDDFSVNTNKFTVDGGTGDTVIAGSLSVTKVADDTLAVSASRSGADVTGYIKNTGGTAASTTSRFSIGQTNSESTAIQIIFNHNDGVATFFNRLTTTGTIKLKTTAGETIMANDGSLSVDGTTFNVDATNNRVGIGTASPAVQFHTTGAVRFAGITSGLLEVDPSGNVSANNSGLTAGSFTTVDLKTVSYNIFGLITNVT